MITRSVSHRYPSDVQLVISEWSGARRPGVDPLLGLS